MTPECGKALALGLYRVHWTSGGTSFASLGNGPDGVRWIAPINWSFPGRIEDTKDWDGSNMCWADIQKMDRLDSDIDPVEAPEVIVKNDIARVIVRGNSLTPYANALRRHRSQDYEACTAWVLVLEPGKFPSDYTGHLGEVQDVYLTWKPDWEEDLLKAREAGRIWYESLRTKPKTA